MLSPEVLRWLAVSITTHAVDWKNTKSMMQCKTYGLCPCSRTTRAGVLRWSHATTTQINKESEYSIMRVARCKRPCKGNSARYKYRYISTVQKIQISKYHNKRLSFQMHQKFKRKDSNIRWKSNALHLPNSQATLLATKVMLIRLIRCYGHVAEFQH